MTLSPRAQQSLNKPLFWSYCTLVVWANVLRKIKKIKIPSPSSSSSQEGEHLCGMSQSPHQLMFNLYNIIALTGENQIVQYFKFIIVNLPLYIENVMMLLKNTSSLTEIKGYAMLQFSYMMLKIYGKVKLHFRMLSLANNFLIIMIFRVISQWKNKEHEKSLNFRPKRKWRALSW